MPRSNRLSWSRYPKGSAEAFCAAMLSELGFDEDPETGLTPELFVGFLRDMDPRRPAPGVAPIATEGTDLVILKDIPFHSICAHHLLPFSGTAVIGYRPAGMVAGLGSIVRLLHHHAARPQVQERLGCDLAEDLLQRLGAASVLVRLQARHLCMEMRSTRTPGIVETLTLRGKKDEELQLRI